MGNKHDFCSSGKYNVQKSKKQKNKKCRPIDDEFTCNYESSRKKKRKSSFRSLNDKSSSSSRNVSLRSATSRDLLNDAFESPYDKKYYSETCDTPELSSPSENLDFRSSLNLFSEEACKINPDETSYNRDTLTSRDNSSMRSSLDPISEDTCENVLDKTLYRPTDVPKDALEIPEDRDWSGEFDPDFDVHEQLQKQPSKSSLRTKPRSILSRPVNTYKYFDEDDNLKYVVGGYSHSTYIRRLIVFIESLILSMDFIIMKGFIPGVNYEANLFGNIQSINDLFRDELMPMLIYSVYNTKQNKYYGELKKSLQRAIQQFLNYSTSPSLIYKFREQKQFFYFSDEPDKDTKFVTSVRRNEYSKLAENLFLFISTILQAVFLKRIHYRVLQEMFQFLKEELHRAATNVLISEDD